jgi:hypothetical protein
VQIDNQSKVQSAKMAQDNAQTHLVSTATCHHSSAGLASETPMLDKSVKQRKKASDVCIEDAEKAVRDAHAHGTLPKVAMIELKVFLKAHHLPLGGKKAEVLERVENLLRSV